ncbi:Patellin-3 [Hibiscus syriacus]|uniref:Patellin-3 n=1 Tax=Hibiscus syriacus TaxID=106335 RepID=A0A6A2XUC3_HIBSY|nr:Patellin-3 [Hibiscus syriacus]
MAGETPTQTLPPVSTTPTVSVSVTESVSTAIAEKQEQTPPPELVESELDSTVEVENQEMAPPPPVESESESPAVTEKPNEEEPPAPAASTVVMSESEMHQPPSTLPREVVRESRSLAAMMDKDKTEAQKPTLTSCTTTSAQEVSAIVGDKKIPQNLGSFKEESNKVADLSNVERKALEELKQIVQEAIDANLFTSETNTEENPENRKKEHPTEVSIWGIPLLKDDRSDVILLKFLRARDFKVKESFAMIKNTIKWRNEFRIDELLDEDFSDDMEKVVFMHGKDREGHPVCYNLYWEFQNKDLYRKAFSDEEKRMKFLRWRIQFLEKSIRKLDFRPGGVSTVFQVSDLKNSPGPGRREHRLFVDALILAFMFGLGVYKCSLVVPSFYTMISQFMSQRTKSKFVFAGPAKSAETLFKYIPPEQVPIQYGGLSVDYCDCNPEFSDADPATEITVKPGTKQTVEITIYEKCVLVWEIRVVGWEVSYGSEFKPNAKDGYIVIIHKPRKMSAKDEAVVSQSFKVSELAKVFLAVDNPSSKKKNLLYRFKVKPF